MGLLGLVSLGACGGTQIGNGLTFEMDLRGAKSVGVPDAGAKLASLSSALVGPQSLNEQAMAPQSGASSAQLFAFNESGAVTGQITDLSLDVDNVWSLDRGILIKISETYYFMSYATGQSVELSSEVSSSIDSYLGQNSDGHLIFSNLKKVDLDPLSTGGVPTVSTIGSTLESPRLRSMSGNFVSLYTSEDLVGTYQVLDTTTNERFNVAACNSGVPTALSSTLAYVNDCTSNELLDFASSGARSSISSKPGGTLATSNIVSLASGAIGYLAGYGTFSTQQRRELH